VVELDDKLVAQRKYEDAVRAVEAVRSGVAPSKVAGLLGVSIGMVEAGMSIVVRYPTTSAFLEAYDRHTPALGITKSWDTFVRSGDLATEEYAVLDAAEERVRSSIRAWEVSLAYGTPDVAQRSRSINSIRAWIRQRLPQNAGALVDKDFLLSGPCSWCGGDYSDSTLRDIGNGLWAACCSECAEANVVHVRYDIVARRYADYAMEAEEAYLRAMGL
jgi:hypothetical protein